MTLQRINLTFTHCCYCDSAGATPFDEHPILQRMRELEQEGRVQMIWEDCPACIKQGAPENTKVLIECELNE